MHRKLAIGAAAATAALAIAVPSAAVADTISVPLSFNHAVLDTPATPDAQIVSPSTAPLNVTAEVDPTTGNFTIQPSDMSAPSYTFTQPVPGTATISLKQPATGTIDFANGALTMNADFLATITVNGMGSCTKDTGPLTLSTSSTQPIPGQNFPAGPTGVESGAGAFSASWSTLAPGTGSACSLIDAATAGSGGIWISRNIAPPTTTGTTTKSPKLSLKAPKRKSIKAGKTTTVTVTLANKGGADTKSIKVCLAAKKPLSPTKDCKTVAKPKANSTHKLNFKVKTKKGKTGTYKLALTATGFKKQTVALKVTK